MKKLIILLALAATTSGCATVVNDYEVKRLTEACEKHGGLRYIVANGDWSEAVCQNGHRVFHRYMEKR